LCSVYSINLGLLIHILIYAYCKIITRLY